MTTQINVTVDRGGLLERNKQQTNANRQARLEQDAQSATEAEAQQKRTERLAADGLNADGTPKASNYPKTQRVNQQPAANRSGIKLYLDLNHPPIEVIEDDPLASEEIPTKADEIYITGDKLTTYSFAVDDLRAKGAASSATSSRIFYKSSAFSRGYYVVPYDPSGNPPPVFVGSAVMTSNYSTTSGPQNTPAISITHQVTSRFGGGILFQPDDNGDSILRKRIEFTSSQSTAEFYVKASGNSLTHIEFRFYNALVYIDSSASESNVYFSDTGQSVSIDVSLSDFENWKHVAMIFANKTFYVYISGGLVASSAGDMAQTINGMPDIYLYGPHPNTQTLSVSGIRVVDRPLYSNNFTPPPIIR